MHKKTEKLMVKVKPYSHQPSKAELEEPFYVAAPNPKMLAKAIMAGGAKRKEPD